MFAARLSLFIAALASCAAPSFAQPTEVKLVLNAGHRFIQKVVYDPQQRWVATAGETLIKIWERRTGRLLRTMEGHTGSVAHLVTNSDGSQLISGALSGAEIRVWETESGRLTRSLVSKDPASKHATFVSDLAISKEGLLAVASGSRIAIWNPTEGKELFSFSISCEYPFPEECPQMAASPSGKIALSSDGKQIAVGYNKLNFDRAAIGLWDVRRGKLIHVYQAHAGDVSVLSFSPDNHSLLSAGKDGQIKIWDWKTKREVRSLPGHVDSSGGPGTWGLAYSHNAAFIASCGDDGVVNVWDSKTSKLAWSHKWTELAERSKRTLAFSRDGQIAIPSGGALEIFDIATSKMKARIPASSTSAGSMAITSGSNALVSSFSDAGMKSRLFELDFHTGGVTESYSADTSQSLYLVNPLPRSVDGRWLVPGLRKIASDRWEPNLWDLRAARSVAEFRWREGDLPGEFTRVTASFDARWVALWAMRPSSPEPDQKREYSKVKVFDGENGQLIRTLEGTEKVQHVLFSPDRRTIASFEISAVGDRDLKLWDIDTGKLVRSLRDTGSHVMSFSPDGRWLAVAGIFKPRESNCQASNTCDHTQEMSLLEVKTGRQLWARRHASKDLVTHISISSVKAARPYILTAHIHATPTMWDLATGRVLGPLEGNLGSPQSLAISEDGSRIIVSNSSGTVSIWDAKERKLLATTIFGSDKEWATVTTEGFFVASEAGHLLLHRSRGFQTRGVKNQKALINRPELIREKLAGDPQSIVEGEASLLRLEW